VSISLDPSSEQQQILASVGRLLAEQFPVARLRGEQAAKATPAQSVVALAGIGALGLGLSEELGGAGFGLTEDMLLFVELGRQLMTPAVLATVLAARLAAECGRQDVVRSLLAGQQVVGLAQPLGPWSSSAQEQMVHLVDGANAELALLWSDAGMGLVSTSHLRLQTLSPMDRSVSLHRAMIEPAALQLWRPADQTRLQAQAQLLLSAQLLGMAQACCDMAVAYAKLRSQFGRPIGSFQAIKHRCADMAVRVEVLRAQLHLATLAQTRPMADADFQLAACRWLAVDHALANARSNIQIHGGIGFAAECDAHLYVLRAHLYDQLSGSRRAEGECLLAQRWADENQPVPIAPPSLTRSKE